MNMQRQARVLEASFASPRTLSREEAMKARELAWNLCKVLAIPGHAVEAAAHYKRALDMIDEREVP